MLVDRRLQRGAFLCLLVNVAHDARRLHRVERVQHRGPAYCETFALHVMLCTRTNPTNQPTNQRYGVYFFVGGKGEARDCPTRWPRRVRSWSSCTWPSKSRSRRWRWSRPSARRPASARPPRACAWRRARRRRGRRWCSCSR